MKPLGLSLKASFVIIRALTLFRLSGGVPKCCYLSFIWLFIPLCPRKHQKTGVRNADTLPPLQLHVQVHNWSRLEMCRNPDQAVTMWMLHAVPRVCSFLLRFRDSMLTHAQRKVKNFHSSDIFAVSCGIPGPMHTSSLKQNLSGKLCSQKNYNKPSFLYCVYLFFILNTIFVVSYILNAYTQENKFFEQTRQHHS